MIIAHNKSEHPFKKTKNFQKKIEMKSNFNNLINSI